MADPINFEYPEPVAPISQLCALPFVAAVAGYLTNGLRLAHARVTLHRVMSRDGLAYLQQLCAYGTSGDSLDHARAGRLFASTTGIIGKAFGERLIVRTRELADEDEWWSAYRRDRVAVGETGPELREATSYLAIPMLAPGGGDPVCILFADVPALNTFADLERIGTIVAMCAGFVRAMDGLARTPIPRLRNYPLPLGTPHREAPTAYPELQEAIGNPEPPRFEHLASFNFSAAP